METVKLPDGIEIKEGILLDRDDNPIQSPSPEPRAYSLALSAGPWIGALVLILLIFAGVTFFGVIAAVLSGFWLLRSVLRLFGITAIRR